MNDEVTILFLLGKQLDDAFITTGLNFLCFFHRQGWPRHYLALGIAFVLVFFLQIVYWIQDFVQAAWTWEQIYLEMPSPMKRILCDFQNFDKDMATVMLMTTICQSLNDGDSLKILIAELFSWWLLMIWIGHQHLKIANKLIATYHPLKMSRPSIIYVRYSNSLTVRS